MPAGATLDWFVYPDKWSFFLALRLVCSALIILALLFARTSAGYRHYRLLGLVLAMLPSFFISWMIFETEGAASPYYAGLNLVLLVVGFVLNWTFRESFIAVAAAFSMYLMASFLHGPRPDGGELFNNLYFLVLTGIIVVTGSHYHTRLRMSEFALRYQLDQNRQELEQTNQKLLELDQVKSRFFANISHELRTPLTLLIAPLENLMNRFGANFDQPTRQLLVTMHSNGMRLLKLINDLLDLVRLESGVMQVKREAVVLVEFIQGLVSAARQMADDKRIQLVAAVDAEIGRILVDRDKLEKIILNLQFNALKFTPAGGRVEIQARREGEQVVISVVDTGMGISEKNLPNVFSRFWQADDTSRRKYQGMGIGLALVKELTEVQQGEAAVRSVEGKGTTFIIRLPYLVAEAGDTAEVSGEAESDMAAVSGARPMAGGSTVSNQEWLSSLYRRAEMFPAMTSVQDAIRPVETTQSSHLPKALVADDEPDMLRFLKSQLQERYQVLEAVDGQQAVEKASQFLPDVILLDMMMPEKDGIQACREIRGRTPTASIPVILITARADEETKMAALSAGASDFLPKPFSTTELHVRVKNLVESYAYQRQLSKQNTLLENTIEQLKETETQLVQTEKLASLGRMSAGMIHEINNPLNFASTALYTLRTFGRHLGESERADFEEMVHDVEDGLKRVVNIVTDLRSFSHQESVHASDVGVARAVESALRFLSHEWRDRVQMQVDVREDLKVVANQNKFIQVLVNLLQNALDAVKEKAYEGERPTISITGAEREGCVTLQVRDNGKGITGEEMGKIFDPFFTTKDVGQGMGLGLSICYRIMQECQGNISVNSEPGKFSEFTLEFPVKTNCEAA